MKITKQTLTDAGWECIEFGDHGPATPKEYRDRYEVWAHVSEISRGCIRHRLIYDRTTDEWRMNGKTVTDTDEL